MGLCFLLLYNLILATSTSLSAAQDSGGAGVELWCVAKNNAVDSALQAAIDWACGPGAADCGPVEQGGPCYDPSDILRTASYAFNDYFLKHGLTEESCNFANTAAITSLNPSHGNCTFPSSFTVSNGSSVGSATGGAVPVNADLSDGSTANRWTLGLVAVCCSFFLCNFLDFMSIRC